jgi:hypothetical protein
MAGPAYAGPGHLTSRTSVACVLHEAFAAGGLKLGDRDYPVPVRINLSEVNNKGPGSATDVKIADLIFLLLWI